MRERANLSRLREPRNLELVVTLSSCYTEKDIAAPSTQSTILILLGHVEAISPTCLTLDADKVQAALGSHGSCQQSLAAAGRAVQESPGREACWRGFEQPAVLDGKLRVTSLREDPFTAGGDPEGKRVGDGSIVSTSHKHSFSGTRGGGRGAVTGMS